MTSHPTIRKPNLFLAGAPKCGTTAFYSYLSEHPQIFMSPRKEPQYFGHDFNKRPLNAYQHIADEDSYLALFNDGIHHPYRGEASTSYFYSTTAAQEIHAFSPTAKIIIMLRNPVEMMYSLYYQQLELGIEFLPTFEKALAAEPERRRGEQLAKSVYISESVCYQYIAQYATHLNRYLEVFGRKQVHIIIFDDFKADSHRVYEDALRFLELELDYQESFSVINPNSQPRNLIIRDFLSNPPSWILKLGALILPISRPVYRMLRKLNTEPVQRPQINPATEQQLCSELQDEIQSLSRLIGRDLSHWCQNIENPIDVE